MSDMLCQIAQDKFNFQGKNMAMVCPNCRVSLTALKEDVTPAPCENCQTCLSVFTPINMPTFPIPYVCRHWLSPTRNSLATCNDHQCKLPPKVARPVSQIEITSPRTHISGGSVALSNGGHVSFGNSNRVSLGNLQFEIAPEITRSNSPETNVVIPDIVFSFNGVPIASVSVPSWSSEDDHRLLAKTKVDLQKCGWYYGSLSWQKAATILATSKDGTFLIRDSSSSRCPFAISVQTSQGPTSIRIEYEKGKFWLDCERKGITPQFDSVMDLVSYYKDLADPNSDFTKNPGKSVWVDHKGRVFSPIKIIKPLFKNISSLKHLCRVAINNQQNVNIYSLPQSILSYLSSYTHKL